MKFGDDNMRKLLILIAVLMLTFTLTGCNPFGASETTTETVVTTTVDYDNIIEISSVSELQGMEMNKSYKLVADLDLTGMEWSPIGTYLTPYLGNFDGNDHTITNLTITEDSMYNGLFGFLLGNVYDLNITNMDINVESSFICYVGGLAGYTNGDIENVSVSGSITVDNSDGNSYVGMLLGFTQGKVDEETTLEDFVPNLIDNNTVEGTLYVTTSNVGFIGGLVGKTYNTTVSNNVSTATLEVIGGEFPLYVGGLVGHNYGGIRIGFEELIDETEIYIENNVVKTSIAVTLSEQNASIGGFVGYNNKGTNRNNYVEATITVDGDALETNTVKIGGYAGENWESGFEKLVMNSSYTDNVVGTKVLMVGPYMGGDFTNTSNVFSNLYISSTSNFEVDGFVVQSSDLTTATFYQDTMGWSPEFYNKIITE